MASLSRRGRRFSVNITFKQFKRYLEVLKEHGEDVLRREIDEEDQEREHKVGELANLSSRSLGNGKKRRNSKDLSGVKDSTVRPDGWKVLQESGYNTRRASIGRRRKSSITKGVDLLQPRCEETTDATTNGNEPGNQNGKVVKESDKEVNAQLNSLLLEKERRESHGDLLNCETTHADGTVVNVKQVSILPGLHSNGKLDKDQTQSRQERMDLNRPKRKGNNRRHDVLKDRPDNNEDTMLSKPSVEIRPTLQIQSHLQLKPKGPTICKGSAEENETRITALNAYRYSIMAKEDEFLKKVANPEKKKTQKHTGKPGLPSGQFLSRNCYARQSVYNKESQPESPSDRGLGSECSLPILPIEWSKNLKLEEPCYLRETKPQPDYNRKDRRGSIVTERRKSVVSERRPSFCYDRRHSIDLRQFLETQEGGARSRRGSLMQESFVSITGSRRSSLVGLTDGAESATNSYMGSRRASLDRAPRRYTLEKLILGSTIPEGRRRRRGGPKYKQHLVYYADPPTPLRVYVTPRTDPPEKYVEGITDEAGRPLLPLSRKYIMAGLVYNKSSRSLAPSRPTEPKVSLQASPTTRNVFSVASGPFQAAHSPSRYSLSRSSNRSQPVRNLSTSP